MGRPIAGFGFFTGNKRLDAETTGFEKVKVMACIDSDTAVEAQIIKQTGFNKYLVKSTVGDKEGIVMLAPVADKIGLATLKMISNVDASEKLVSKLTRNIVQTFDAINSNVYTYLYEYEVDETGTPIKGAFCEDKDIAQVKLDIITSTNQPDLLTKAFTITPTPTDAVVTINGDAVSTINAHEGDSINWEVSKAGFVTQTGSWVMKKTAKTLPIALVVE